MIEIQNMLEFGRLMLCFPEMLCLEKWSRRGVHAEPREVLLRVVQAGDVEVFLVVGVLRLSLRMALVELLRWMADGKLVLGSRRRLRCRRRRVGAICSCGQVLLLL